MMVNWQNIIFLFQLHSNSTSLYVTAIQFFGRKMQDLLTQNLQMQCLDSYEKLDNTHIQT